MFKFFSSCHKIGILFLNLPLLIIIFSVESIVISPSVPGWLLACLQCIMSLNAKSLVVQFSLLAMGGWGAGRNYTRKSVQQGLSAISRLSNKTLANFPHMYIMYDPPPFWSTIDVIYYSFQVVLTSLSQYKQVTHSLKGKQLSLYKFHKL